MKTEKLLSSMLLTAFIVLSISHASANTSQTHSLDTNTFHFRLANDANIFFSESPIYLGNSNGLWYWLGSSGIGFYNLRVGSSNCPGNWHIITDANITIVELFENDRFKMTVAKGTGETSTTQVYCGNKGEPMTVDGADSWSYDESTERCTVLVTHSSSQNVTLSWHSQEPDARGRMSTANKETKL